MISLLATTTAVFAAQALLVHSAPTTKTSCDHVQSGYQCQDAISHNWGQYSPYFTLDDESAISDCVPDQCTVNFVQLISRHGARFPTSSKSKKYNATITALKQNVTSYTGKYSFLKDFEYTLGSDVLTEFGQQQLVNSGIKFYERYESLAKKTTPFVRSDASARVFQSAQNWTYGYHETRLADRSAASTADGYPYDILELSDADASNNTLDPSTCDAYENGYESNTGDDAQATFADTFIPTIMARLNKDLLGADLTEIQTVYMMDMCPFETVASNTGKISDFCSLFTQEEWENYNYYQSLGKYYSDGNGNYLGATQGVGWVNELIARLTNQAVEHGASVNSTLDASNATFPLGRSLYADFSHDDPMTSIFSAMGLYNSTPALSNTTLADAQALDGYSAAWTVPFAARMYVEKMTCAGAPEDLVRVIINDRVVPLVGCAADALGRCTLSAFVESQSFSRELGLWDQC